MTTLIRIFILVAAALVLPLGLSAWPFDNRTEGSVFTRSPDGSAEKAAAAAAEAGPAGDELTVGTKSIQFRFSKTGKWLSLFSSWSEQESAFLDGGFFVTAAGGDGQLRVLAATTPIITDSKARAGDEAFRLEPLGFGRCWEGNEGGNRAPTVDPDDDGDGQADEDPFDGIDNDGDGRIDEDFAAIGDEMVVLEYKSVFGREKVLKFHQENSTWSLPHIDGLIAVRLTITNSSRETIRHVRVGTCLRKDGPFAIAQRQYSSRVGDKAPLERAGALTWINPQGSAVGLVFPEQLDLPDGETSWEFWTLKTGEALETALQNLISPGADIKSPDPAGNGDAPGIGFESTGLDRITYEKNVLAGGLSPDLGDLEPGASRRITVLLVAMPKEQTLDRALSFAHRTFLGDGINRLLPPVVAVTPYLVWGAYTRAEFPDNGLILTFEDNPSHHFEADRITFLCGVDDGDLERITRNGTVTEIQIRGGSAERLQQKEGGRIILKGRDETGAFFDAVLNPAGGELSGTATAAANAERYWRTAGKLPETLLSGSPNPFREQTTVFYEVPSLIETEDGRGLRFEGTVETSLKVFDVTGRLVNVLADEISGPGRYQTGWQAIDENGSSVASGVYYIKLQIGKRYITKRLILLK